MGKQLDKSNLGYLDLEFQYKLVKIFVEEPKFFEDIASIVDQNAFTDALLRTFVGTVKDYYKNENVMPSYEVIGFLLNQKAKTQNDIDEWNALVNKLKFETSYEGYTIVKDLGFSLPIQLGVLEHHEKENGTGYPRHLTGDKISPNGKIIAVACTYEAISSPRSYKDERSTFDALIELIQNKDHIYDDSILKGLLYTVSLYPIGTYVYLSNRKIAEVIDSNPENPKCPVVQLLTEKEADGSLKVVQTGKDNITIINTI